MKKKYRIHIHGPHHVIRKKVFKIFPTETYYYSANGDINQSRSGWFDWVNAEYGVLSNNKWQFLGYAPIWI